ncbi:MAG: hypothetical protein ABIQ44_15190 [Chloroflexia bacterium]
MPDNTDMPNTVRGDELRQPPPNWRPGLEPIPMFEEARSVNFEVEILEESYRELLAFMRAKEWDAEFGLRAIFLAGLGYEKAQWHLDAITALAQRNDPTLSERVDEMVNELASYHSMYSVLKFKSFKLYRINQVLEFNNSGLRAQEDLWHEWAARMRRDKEGLQGEVIRLRSMLSEFKLDWDKSGAPPLPPALSAATEEQSLRGEFQPTQTNQSTSDDISPEPDISALGFWGRLRWVFFPNRQK